ncbi:MAG: hypothetical protein LBV67_12715 [Streptococcaceae bacterium]|jgi:hypothetical protein|nr:hypothetical protein [Streptococcaceae bacterium]
MKKFRIIQEQFLRDQTLETLKNIYRSENSIRKSVGRIALINLLALLILGQVAVMSRLVFTSIMVLSFLLIYVYRGKQRLITLIRSIIEEKEEKFA